TLSKTRNWKAACPRKMKHCNLCVANSLFESRVALRVSARINCFELTRRRRDLSLEQAGAGLEKIVADALRLMPPAEAPLMAWPIVCGSGVAERSRAVSFSGGVLRIEVADAGWKRELQALAPRYLATINRYDKHGVQRLEFVVRGER